jgi:trehalose 6-phosphate synthase/phosphatase
MTAKSQITTTTGLNAPTAVGAVRYNSAEEVVSRLPCSGRLLIVLDKDGTLDPFVPDPTKAIVNPEIVEVLQKLASLPEVDLVIASGRSVSQLKDLVGPLPIRFLGLHGNEEGRGNITALERAPDERLLEPISNLRESLTARYLEQGLSPTTIDQIIENKGFGIAVHSRRNPQHTEVIFSVFEEELNRSGILELVDQSGRSIFSVQPGDQVSELKYSNYNKGRAVKEILQSCTYDHVLCAGDDLTDLTMFKAVAENCTSFTNVIIADRISHDGALRLSDPDALHQVLRGILRSRELLS